MIVEDHPLFRKGLKTLLTSVSDFEVVGECGDGEQAVEQAHALQPDVMLMDIKLPGKNGVAATRSIVSALPATKVLMVTLFEDDDSVFSALRAGASGYLLKEAGEEEIIRAIRSVRNGEAIFGPGIAQRVMAFFANPTIVAPDIFPTLTDRERAILQLLAQGKSNPAIAAELSVSTKTVANNVSTIFAKLQVADRAEAIIRARDAGLGKR